MHEKIPELLQFVRSLQFYEDKLVQAEGGRFNVFELLGVGSLEAATHTPYLAEFLNPKGVHGLGQEPLAAFVQRFKLTLNPATTRVAQEYPLGQVTEVAGGRVDILLTDGDGQQVAIENKLFAADQPNQLQRYKNGLHRDARLIYLTLHRTEPSEGSIREKKDILLLSYARDIIAWQEDCRRIAAVHPVVRETITQYINLIKHLTNQSTNSRMSTQITDAALKDPSSLAAYFELVKSVTDVRARIIAKLKADCEILAEELSLDVKFGDDLGKTEGSFSFFDFSMGEHAISIAFNFARPNFKGLYFGICYDHPSKSHLAPPGLLAEFNRVFGNVGNSTEWWPAWVYWQTRIDWSDSTFADIAFDRFQPELREKVETLLSIVRTVQKAQINTPK